jgi:hypothetical protein
MILIVTLSVFKQGLCQNARSNGPSFKHVAAGNVAVLRRYVAKWQLAG